ncbi:hypothetical protein SRHO_G00222580 [Serrasalmus rhombeus]
MQRVDVEDEGEREKKATKSLEKERGGRSHLYSGTSGRRAPASELFELNCVGGSSIRPQRPTLSVTNESVLLCAETPTPMMKRHAVVSVLERVEPLLFTHSRWWRAERWAGPNNHRDVFIHVERAGARHTQRYGTARHAELQANLTDAHSH